MVKVGIVGVSGYSGGLLLELLLKHPNVRVTYVSANNTSGHVTDIWPRLNGLTDLSCNKYTAEKAITACGCVFLAVPHTVSMGITPALLKAGKKIIDLTGDYRLEDQTEYLKWYGTEHKDSGNLKKAVYGLPELYRNDIKKAQLVANPGCYPTGAILGLAPLVATNAKSIRSVIVDAKSGVTGAGKKVTANFIFAEVNENFKAYKILNHQHAPEINLYLSRLSEKKIDVQFVPHLLPINRGILNTIYVQLAKEIELAKIHEIYKKFYKTEPYVRVCEPGTQPEIKNVVGTNFCDIGLTLSANKKLLVIVTTIDNLLKGASAQAIQNMNIMYGFKETEGVP